jgi:hypothetical protein
MRYSENQQTAHMQVVRENRWSSWCKRLLSFRNIGRLALFAEAVLLYSAFVLPPLLQLDRKLRQMKHSIPAELPSMSFDSTGTHIKGNLPFLWRLPDSAVILYTQEPDSLFLKDKPIYSLVCSDSLFLFKTGSGIIPFRDTKLGDQTKWTLDKKSLIRIIDFLLYTGKGLLHGLGLFSFLLFSGVLVLFGAGVASIVDGFSNGPFHFRELLRISAVIFLLAAIVMIVMHFEGLSFLLICKWVIPAYLSVMFVITYILIRKIYGD